MYLYLKLDSERDHRLHCDLAVNTLGKKIILKKWGRNFPKLLVLALETKSVIC